MHTGLTTVGFGSVLANSSRKLATSKKAAPGGLKGAILLKETDWGDWIEADSILEGEYEDCSERSFLSKAPWEIYEAVMKLKGFRPYLFNAYA